MTLTEKGRAALSAARKAEWADPQQRAIRIAALTGRKHSLESRAKMSAQRKGVTKTAHRALTFEQAKEVRRLKAKGLTYGQLALKFKMDRTSLWCIVKGKTYVIP